MKPAHSAPPIGVFDSGLGGLTVVRRLRERLPNESVLYLADQAHVPYGGRPLDEVRSFARSISAALFDEGCKAIVMACNISSATALPDVRSAHPEIPVLGVIEPGARAAVRRTESGRIGVLATEGTVRSGAYTRTIAGLDPTATVTEIACPRFVPIVEAGEIDSLDAESAARRYLAPLLRAEVDTVVLGCTHYPFLLPVLQRLAPLLTFVDPAEETVEELTEQLKRGQLAATFLRDPSIMLCTTGERAQFASQIGAFLPDFGRVDVRPAEWTVRGLCFPALIPA